MQQSFPFQPRANNQSPPSAQVNGAVTAAVTQIALAAIPDSETTARFVVDGTQSIAWAYGTQAGLTLGNGCFMLPNTVETFMIPPGTAQISVISGATGSTLRIVVGDGQ